MKNGMKYELKQTLVSDIGWEDEGERNEGWNSVIAVDSICRAVYLQYPYFLGIHSPVGTAFGHDRYQDRSVTKLLWSQ